MGICHLVFFALGLVKVLLDQKSVQRGFISGTYLLFLLKFLDGSAAAEA